MGIKIGDYYKGKEGSVILGVYKITDDRAYYFYHSENDRLSTGNMPSETLALVLKNRYKLLIKDET